MRHFSYVQYRKPTRVHAAASLTLTSVLATVLGAASARAEAPMDHHDPRTELVKSPPAPVEAPAPETDVDWASMVRTLGARGGAHANTLNDEQLAELSLAAHALARQPKVPPDIAAKALVVAADAEHVLAGRHHDIGHAKTAFQAVVRAARLAPDVPEAVVAYGKTVRGYSRQYQQRNFIERWFMQRLLHVDVHSDASRALELLKRFPQVPTAQLLRIQLAQFLRDGAVERDATNALRELERHFPDARQVAEAELAIDDGRAASHASP